MSGRWWLLISFCILGLVAGLALGRHAQPLPSQPPTISSTANPIDLVTAADLTRLVGSHPGPILLEFHASWCKPCQELAPRVESLAAHHPDLAVARVDAVTATELTVRYDIETLPVLIRLQGGVEVDRTVGAPSAPELERWVMRPLGQPPSAPHASP